MKFQNKIEFLLLKFLTKILCIPGIKKIPETAKLLSLFLYYFVPLRKNIIRKNFKIAFPDISEDELKNYTKKIYYSLSITLVELFCFFKFHKETLLNLVRIDNLEMIQQILNKKKGLIFLTAHFGNWELSVTAMRLYLNKTIHVLAKPQRNDLVFAWLNSMRETYGNKVVPLGSSVKEIYKVLKENGIVGVVGDQRGHPDGMRVKFFNRDTAVYPGAASFAIKLNKPVLFALMIRSGDFKYNLIVEQIPIETFEGTTEEKVRQINQFYMSRLEHYIKKYPEQWFWMHNIWKY